MHIPLFVHSVHPFRLPSTIKNMKIGGHTSPKGTVAYLIAEQASGLPLRRSFNLHSVFCKVQSELSKQCDLVPPLSIYSILSLPQGYPVAAYVFLLVFPSLLSFPPSLLQ
jgi:hypothetical protein